MFLSRQQYVFVSSVIAIVFLTPNISAFGQEKPDSIKKLDPRKVYAPSKNPDRIILTWSEDPATTQTVNWRTDETVDASFAEITAATDGPGFVPSLRRLPSKTNVLDSSNGLAKYHRVTFRDLNPATKYVYRVGDGINWSEFSHFTTASKKREPFSFVYFGDAQNAIKSHWSRVVRESFKDAPRASFFLHAGDLVNQANNDSEWGEWFYAAGWINRTVPSVATPGNHEYANGALSKHWQSTFEFPRNGPKGLEDTVYYIDFQGTRIVSLNSNVKLKEQVTWLRGVLKNNSNVWTILTFHHPIFSTAKGRDNKELRELLQPVFDQYKVDLVLQGHDHTYGRTGLVQHHHDASDKHHDAGDKHHVHPKQVNVPTGRKARGKGGTVYVVSVSGPKMYRLGQTEIFQKQAEFKQLYQIISIDGDTLSYSARTAKGTVFDEFKLKKVGDEPNRLIEADKKKDVIQSNAADTQIDDPAQARKPSKKF